MTEQSLSGKRSLFGLIRGLPSLLTDLIRAELERMKTEMVGKLKHAGIGIGMFAGAALFGFFAFAVFVATAIIALALVWPTWLAALVIGVLLLLGAGGLAFLGMRWFKRAMPPVPEETMASLREDVNAVKGVGGYEH